MIGILTDRHPSDFDGCASVITPARPAFAITERHCFHAGAFTVVTLHIHSWHTRTSQLTHCTSQLAHLHFTVVTFALHCFHTCTSQLSHLHFTVVTPALHSCHTGTSQLSHRHFHSCHTGTFTVVTSALSQLSHRRFHSCHTCTSQLSHLHFTVVTQALSQFVTQALSQLSRRRFHSCHAGAFTVVTPALSQLSHRCFHSYHTGAFTVVTHAVPEISEDSCNRPIGKERQNRTGLRQRTEKQSSAAFGKTCKKR